MFVMIHIHTYKHIYFQTIQIEIIYSIFYYISLYYWISYKEYYSLKKIPYTGIIYFFKNFIHDFRNTYTIIHRNHDIEMRLLGWNKDNQFEIHGSIGKIHKSLAIYSRGLKLRKIVYRVLCRNLGTFFLFSLRISTTWWKGKKEK